jgi:guanylate kinase
MGQSLQRRGLCLVISAPSGAGKSTLARALLESEAELTLSVSVTTRQPRPGERDGIDYHFVDDAEFARLAHDGSLLEWAHVFGRGYGTRRAPVEAALAAGRDVLFDIDWQGWRQVKAALPEDAVGVFVLPPSIAALRARLVGRAGDDAAEIMRRRLAECLDNLRAVLRAGRSAARRQPGVQALVTALNADAD